MPQEKSHFSVGKVVAMMMIMMMMMMAMMMTMPHSNTVNP